VIPISGTTRIFPVIGWPVEQVKAPAIYNAYFSRNRIDAVCVPMRVPPHEYVAFVKSMMRASNVGGICVSIPHKPASVDAADVSTRIAKVAGAANAIYRNASGEVVADLIDGEGFVRALDRTTHPHGFDYANSSAHIVGCGGVGCAIAAALAERGIARLSLVDVDLAGAEQLAIRLKAAFPSLEVSLQNTTVAGHDLLVNGTPLGMTADDPPPFSIDAAKPTAIVADCGMKTEVTKLLAAATARGLRTQKGKEMLFEQAPLYLERFGWPGTTADEFRALGVL
jgi:shikimate dehydrogenase